MPGATWTYLISIFGSEVDVLAVCICGIRGFLMLDRVVLQVRSVKGRSVKERMSVMGSLKRCYREL